MTAGVGTAQARGDATSTDTAIASSSGESTRPPSCVVLGHRAQLVGEFVGACESAAATVVTSR